MLILISFAFIAGIVTVLSPCILPLLPIILSSTQKGNRPAGVITGFVVSFTIFTLFLSRLVMLSNISPDILRMLAIAVIGVVGISYLFPSFNHFLEKILSNFSRFVPPLPVGHTFGSGVIVGISLGMLWTPCVGPILASVIALALSGSVTISALLITLSYAMGTALPMFVIMRGGSHVRQRIPWIVSHTMHVQQVFGLLMLVTAVSIATNLDRSLQTYLIKTFPSYGKGLTFFEDNALVRSQLAPGNDSSIQAKQGEPLFALLEPKGKKAPEIVPGGEWFNSQPLTLEKLRGKVVLIDFWTYSCINCQRTLPYLKKWWKTYKDTGLVIIGVHAPEFAFEKVSGNVSNAIKDFGISYPVVQDNNFATWKAYENRYWPAKYLIDAKGYIRFTHFGEEGYNETEQAIQQLVKERGKSPVRLPSVNNASYTLYAQTPETYLGYNRIDSFASPEQIIPDTVTAYSVPLVMPMDSFALAGKWKVSPEYIAPTKGGQLSLNFFAKNVYVVMRPTTKQVQVTVYVDNVMQAFGKDVHNGVVTVNADKLYHVVKLQTPGRHTLRIKCSDGSIALFAFTFG